MLMTLEKSFKSLYGLGCFKNNLPVNQGGHEKMVGHADPELRHHSQPTPNSVELEI